MKKTYLSISALFGSTAVALGALGAHYLKGKMQAGIISPDQLTGFDTASKYQLFHAICILVLYFAAKNNSSKWLNRAANFMIAGILLFSGSLYLLCTRPLSGLEHIGFLGPITPLGGIALIAGWLCIFIHALRQT